MAASRIKTLLILMLILTDICLLAIVLPAEGSARAAQQNSQQQLLDILSAGGLQLDVPIPDGEAVPSLLVTYDTEHEESLAGQLLGSDTVLTDDPSRYYRIYSAKSGTVQFYPTGELNGEFSGITAVKSPQEGVLQILKSIGISADILSYTPEDGTILCRQLILTLPVYSAELTFTCRDGSVTAMDGILYTGTMSRMSEETSMNCTEALITLLDSGAAQGDGAIVFCEQGYDKTETASVSTVRLDPVWVIQTDRARYLVNGITGIVTKG